MKKMCFFLPPLLGILMVGSCKNNPVLEKGTLTYGKVYETCSTSETEKIFTICDSYEELRSRLQDKGESLMLVTCQNIKSSCSCYRSFRTQIHDYNAQNNGLFYLITQDKFSGKDTFGLTIPQNDTVTLSFFSKGTLYKQYLYNDSTMKIFSDVEVLTSTINENIKKPHQYLINETQLDAKLANKDDFILSIQRGGCGDCTYTQNNVLSPYFNSNPNSKDMYVFDIESYRQKTQEEYQAIKDKYFLSTKNNPVYGYSTGVVPTIFNIAGGQVNDGIILFNDTVSKIDNQYIINETYYSSNRLNNLHYISDKSSVKIENKILEKDDVIDYGEGYYGWKKDKALSTYKTLFSQFASSYL